MMYAAHMVADLDTPAKLHLINLASDDVNDGIMLYDDVLMIESDALAKLHY